VRDRQVSFEAICLAGFRVPAGKPASQSARMMAKFIGLDDICPINVLEYAYVKHEKA